jgi:antitoxin CptB
VNDGSKTITDGVASTPPSDVARQRLDKLTYRCRRGMKELDFLLLRYVRGGFPAATSLERAAFEEFLELPDPDIARYLIAGHVPEDPNQAAVCRAILQSH